MVCFLAIAQVEVSRLRVVLTNFGLRRRELWRLHVVGTFYGNFLPGQLGADLYKLMVLRSVDGSVVRAGSLLVLLRMSGLPVLLCGAALSLALQGTTLREWVPQGTPLWGASLWPVAFWVVLGVVCLLGGGFLLRDWVLRRNLVQRLKAFLRDVGATLGSLHARQIVVLLLWSVILLVARVYVLHFLVLAVGSSLEFSAALLGVTLATLSTLIPISFAGLGVREGVLVALLSRFDVPYEEAILVAFLGRAFILAISLLGGVWLLMRGRATMGLLRQHRNSDHDSA